LRPPTCPLNDEAEADRHMHSARHMEGSEGYGGDERAERYECECRRIVGRQVPDLTRMQRSWRVVTPQHRTVGGTVLQLLVAVAVGTCAPSSRHPVLVNGPTAPVAWPWTEDLVSSSAPIVAADELSTNELVSKRRGRQAGLPRQVPAAAGPK